MQRLETRDQYCLSAAVGWYELGNLVEAEAELDHVSPERQQHPDVLEIRWAVYAAQQRWPDALQVARGLIEVAPERASGWLHQAYALRRAPNGTLQSAWDALLPVSQKFPEEPNIPYNLSCYACQMQQLDVARVWFRRALALGGKETIKQQALADPDMKPLWEEIRGV